MTSYLDELLAHQEWADAEHWRAFEGHSAALTDKALFERLHHIHFVQHAFLWITGPTTSQFEYKKQEEFSNPATLKSYARQGLAEPRCLLESTGAVPSATPPYWPAW